MASSIKWDAAPNSRGNVLSTELNSLSASGGRSNAGTAIDNATNNDTYGLLELNVTFGSAPSSGAYVSLYLIPSGDGTNYSDGSSSVDPGADTWLLNIPLLASTSAQLKVTKPFPLPPGKFKFILVNNTSQAFPASGSTVELFTANLEAQ